MEVVDSTFLIDLLRGEASAKQFLASQPALVTTQINLFEVIQGLYLREVTAQYLPQVLSLFDSIGVLSLTDAGIIKAAEISAASIKKGKTIGNADCLIAGIALSHGVSVIRTRNVNHFGRIKGISVKSY
tara:strand:- start:467 stop:853 length:387 start_codon:yes stop_codon:yes gene_type:complete